MANKKYEEADIQAIATTIREKTGTDKLYDVSEMASGVNEVYEAGCNAGELALWNIITYEWKRTAYDYAFRGWVTPSIKPPRKIVAKSAQRMFSAAYVKKIEKEYFDISAISDASAFANSSQVEEIEDIGFNNITNYYQAFGNASKVHTIARLGSLETTPYGQTFYNANSLKNITFSGVIGQNISFSHSPLTVKSMKSIITHLKNYTGTDSEKAYTLTLKSSCVTELETAEFTDEDKEWLNEVGITYSDDLTWVDVIDDLKWNLVSA